MPLSDRKERERANRHQLIIATARELAETQGWDAVTTRRLAERIEYSQPVLYSHFHGKNEIISAVALEGFTELTTAIRTAIATHTAPRDLVAALANAYVEFAEHNPALYDAMFRLNSGLPFADPATPAPLHEAFQAFSDALSAVARSTSLGLFVEIFWAALHGLVTLTRDGRIPPEHTAQRLEVLINRLTGLV